MSTTTSAAAATARSDLQHRITVVRAKAATPGYDVPIAPGLVDYEAWNHVGDPLCEALITELRERKMMGCNFYDKAGQLQAQGSVAADRFFQDMEYVPNWADFEAMRAGAAMAARNPLGMALGLHGGLPFTYIDGATARVMARTNRLAASGTDFSRHFWETASGFVAALDVDGSKVGGPPWEQWARIRMLHTMIRLGILRSGRWDLDGMPISQMSTAAFTHIGGVYRVNIIRNFGGVVSQEEEDSFALMWRWISRMEGTNTELLGRTEAQQREVSARIHQHLYSPDDASRAVTKNAIDGLAQMHEFHLPRRVHAAIVRRVLSQDMVQTTPGRDVRADLGLQRDRPVELGIAAAALALKGANQVMRIPPVRRQASALGQKVIDRVIDRGLDGIRPDFSPTAVTGDTH